MALNINGTTGISGVDGSASAPALQGTDSNTGINFGTDTVNVNTGGVTRATIDSGGKLNLTSNIKWASADAYVYSYNGGSDGQVRSGVEYSGSNQFMRFFTGTNERLRILSDGQIFSNGLDGSVDITVSSAADTSDGIQMGKPPFRVTRTSNVPAYLNRNGSGGNIIQFRYGGSVVGSISNNANSLPSDRNYKKDITNLTLGLNLINKLQPVSYHYKFDAASDPVMYGLIAQDVETALSDAGVAQNKAAILQYEEKNDEKQSDYSLDYVKLTPILINAVKELSAKVTTLETKVAALEAA